MITAHPIQFPSLDDNGGCGRASQSSWVDQQMRTAYQIATLLEPHERATAVQAGGNVGIFPWVFAQYFKSVITFEPSPILFPYLLRNLNGAENVRAVNAALSDVGDRAVRFVDDNENCGASHLLRNAREATAETVDVEITTLDSFNLRACDLLQLDVEGYETAALKGAERTIEQHKPLIVVEINGLHCHYVYERPDTWLSRQDYRYVSRIGNDHIFVHKEDGRFNV